MAAYLMSRAVGPFSCYAGRCVADGSLRCLTCCHWQPMGDHGYRTC